MAVIRSENSAETRTFERRLRIGRGSDNDLVLGTSTASTYHACIEWRGDAFWIRDLGSRNGTAVGDARIRDWTKLQVGSKVRFGPDSSWQVEDVQAPPDDKAALAICSGSGRERYPLLEDRFTIGRGGDFDLVLPGEDGALVAALYLEDDACRLVAMADGVVSVAADPLQAGQPRLLVADQQFEVAGQPWVLRVRAGLERTATVDAGLTQRAYAGYRLQLVQRGEFGDIVIHDGVRTHRWTEQELRFHLLWVLTKSSDEQSSGWVDDETLRAGIWGRRAAENQAASTLAKLIHDTRVMLGRKGVDGLFIEKRRGRTRLRLSPSQITLE